jgi:acid phosphatase (class A)
MTAYRLPGALLWLPVVLVFAFPPLPVAAQESGMAPPDAETVSGGFLPGYLPRTELPDSLALTPPPPAGGSAALALDEAVMHERLALYGSPRWALAMQDADLSFPNAASTFACALDAPISQMHTPRLYQLLRRTLTDAGLATYPAKYHHQRARPFLVNEHPICTPAAREQLVDNYAYPSGHAAIGTAWSLILSELAPARADALLARGREFGDSRSVCNVHWHSDIVEGQFLGAATVALLRADQQFRDDLEAARDELARVKESGLAPLRDCDAEFAALRHGADT